MLKRTCEEDLYRLRKKMRKLERKLHNKTNELPVMPEPTPPQLYEPRPGPSKTLANTNQAGEYVLDKTDWLTEEQGQPDPNNPELSEPDDALDGIENIPPAPEASTNAVQTEVTDIVELDDDALEILGEDPSVADQRGKNILSELANRFQHIATEGLSKETRKELTAKYPVPANCILIDAPKINPEMKVAIPESISKREKGVELKQKQMAHAISCLGGIISSQMNSKNKNKEMLQKLMDLGRLLCDIQHSDSTTRKNFIVFSLKKDLKEHLSTAKIDSFLFGESLPDILKSVKTIQKSGTELKEELTTKNVTKKVRTLTPRNLNRKAPGPAYRPLTHSARSHEPAEPRLRAKRPPAPSSKTSRRQFAPPTAPPRYRY